MLVVHVSKLNSIHKLLLIAALCPPPTEGSVWELWTYPPKPDSATMLVVHVSKLDLIYKLLLITALCPRRRSRQCVCLGNLAYS